MDKERTSFGNIIHIHDDGSETLKTPVQAPVNPASLADFSLIN